MAKHLTDRDIADVVSVLDDWPMDSRLTWDLLVEACEHGHGINTTRQTLNKYSRVRSAYQEVKNLISGNKNGGSKGSVNINRKAVPPSLKIAQERLDKKDREIERLKRENEQLLIQFQTWVYNAHLLNLTIEQLSVPLPAVSSYDSKKDKIK